MFDLHFVEFRLSIRSSCPNNLSDFLVCLWSEVCLGTYNDLAPSWLCVDQITNCFDWSTCLELVNHLLYVHTRTSNVHMILWIPRLLLNLCLATLFRVERLEFCTLEAIIYRQIIALQIEHWTMMFIFFACFVIIKI